MLKISKCQVEAAISAQGRDFLCSLSSPLHQAGSFFHWHRSHRHLGLFPWIPNLGFSKWAFSPSFSRWWLAWYKTPKGNQFIKKEKERKQKLYSKGFIFRIYMVEGSGIIILPLFHTYLLSTHHVPGTVWGAGIATVRRLNPDLTKFPFSCKKGNNLKN